MRFCKAIIIAVTVSLGKSNTLEKSMNNSVALRFFAHIPLIIHQIVRICKTVE